MKLHRIAFCLTIATFSQAGFIALSSFASADEAIIEDFEQGFPAGDQLRDHEDWFFEEENSGPVAVESGGAGNSWGLSTGDRAFSWTAKPFSWGDPTLKAVHVGGDWQTDSSGGLDDDRAGWTISNEDDSSDNIFGVQIDPKDGSGAPNSALNIEAYWDGATFGDDGGRTSIVTLPKLDPLTWYRMRATFTKLSDNAAQIVVTFVELDGDKEPTGDVHKGTLADTSKLSDTANNQQPNPAYFTTETVWPVYKNFSNVEGGFDNAYFMIERQEVSPGEDE